MRKIKRVFCKNFLVYKDAEIKFDQGNIISIVGLNSAGKSAFSKILNILCYNAFSTKQKHYIKRGTSKYLIGLETDEGVVITQERFITGNSSKAIWKAEKSGVILYTNKIDDTVLSIDGVPDVSEFSIKNYLGFLVDETTGEFLNIRRRTDKLLYINTTGGDNYKIFNSVLGYDILRNVSGKQNAKYNAENANYQQMLIKQETLSSAMESVDVVPEDLLNDFSSNVYELKTSVTQMQLLEEMQSLQSSLVSLPDQADTINLDKFSALNNLVLLQKELADYNKIPDVELLDTKQLSMLQELCTLYTSIDSVELKEKCEILDVDQFNKLKEIYDLQKEITSENSSEKVEEVTIIDLTAFLDLNNIVSACKEWSIAYNNYTTLLQAKSKLDSYTALAKDLGFKLCPNCGHVYK